MNFLYQYSGVMAAIVSLFLIVLPTFFVGLNYREEPISFVVRKPLQGLLFEVGLLTTTILLFVNMVRLVRLFEIRFTDIGVVFYFTGTLCMAMVAFIDIEMHEPVHTLFTKGYFLLSTLGALLISAEVSPGMSLPFGICLLSVGGMLYLYFYLGYKAQAEYWGIMCAILWTVIFYVC